MVLDKGQYECPACDTVYTYWTQGCDNDPCPTCGLAWDYDEGVVPTNATLRKLVSEVLSLRRIVADFESVTNKLLDNSELHLRGSCCSRPEETD